jgi:hypothetical protein
MRARVIISNKLMATMIIEALPLPSSKSQVPDQFSLNNNSKNKKIRVGMGEEVHFFLLHLCH